jgi:DNA-binding NtrC family response regulator
VPEPARPRGTVLVVEDEAYVRESLGELLRARGYHVILAGTLEHALDCLARAPVDAVLTDLKMPGGDGLELTRRIGATSPDLPVLVLTGHGTISSAVACMKAGASDYILKPADPEALEVALERALSTRTLKREVAYLRSGGRGPGAEELPAGRSPAWLRVMKDVRAAAPTDSTVLLIGESGTGKDVLARLIHRWSARAAAAYVRVNCAAVPLEMWESEFFGHRKGSFTGATADRDGRFKLAHRGTLFMDEIGTMPLPAQAKILRVLESGEFDRLGDEESTHVDVRVVAATNSNLDVEVQAGRFRQDLFFRLNVVRIEVPPLRSRPDDIPILASLFVAEIAARLGRPAPAVAAEVLEDLKAYPWPGNARELRNVLERALILDPGDTLASLDLPPMQGLAAKVPALPPDSDLNLRSILTGREREVLVEALRRSGGVRKEAARLLGIDQRNLGYYLRKHGIDPDHPGG